MRNIHLLRMKFQFLLGRLETRFGEDLHASYLVSIPLR